MLQGCVLRVDLRTKVYLTSRQFIDDPPTQAPLVFSSDRKRVVAALQADLLVSCRVAICNEYHRRLCCVVMLLLRRPGFGPSLRWRVWDRVKHMAASAASVCGDRARLNRASNTNS